jgi:hypothetical protein
VQLTGTNRSKPLNPMILANDLDKRNLATQDPTPPACSGKRQAAHCGRLTQGTLFQDTSLAPAALPAARAPHSQIPRHKFPGTNSPVQIPRYKFPAARGSPRRRPRQPGGHSEGTNTRSHPELGREIPQSKARCAAGVSAINMSVAVALSPASGPPRLQPRALAAQRVPPVPRKEQQPESRTASALLVVEGKTAAFPYQALAQSASRPCAPAPNRPFHASQPSPAVPTSVRPPPIFPAVSPPLRTCQSNPLEKNKTARSCCEPCDGSALRLCATRIRSCTDRAARMSPSSRLRHNPGDN